jgi:hypothetical protein
MFRALRHAFPTRTIVLLITLVAASGCTLNTDVSGPAAIIKFGGDLQTEPTNTTFPTPLAVLVVTQFGEPVQNATVTWIVTSGGGTFDAPSTLTGENGVASVTYTSGATAGSVLIEARVSGLPPLTFVLTVT